MVKSRTATPAGVYRNCSLDAMLARKMMLFCANQADASAGVSAAPAFAAGSSGLVLCAA